MIQGRLLYTLWIVIGLMTWSACKTPVETYEPRRIEVLFLGHDSEHHNAAESLPYLAASLTPKGINFSYSNDPEDLNLHNLNKYDALVIYANHDEITKPQEKALLRFVKNGGGFIPIHSASYCFRNSSKYVKLVGAQFSSHDTATFNLEYVDPDHPILMGLKPFETWDETYVHTRHSPKTVLMSRVENEHAEPYTWIKEFGKGRVFYTALGHDLRTWSHPEFHNLILNGILWAIGSDKKEAWSKLTFPQPDYTPAQIANYEKRDPPPALQSPLSPEQSMQLIQVPPEFELHLFASEPDIVNPIALNFDQLGRLWIAETVDYPNDINIVEGEGNDRIKILEDTDGDGRADRFTVFADKLSVPTSLVFTDGGIIVSQAPHLLFLKDTSGDDVADVREIIMEGWGTFDTHAGPSNLRYGFDNKIWGVVGYSGFDGMVGDDQLQFSSGIYRFNPDGSQLEFMSSTSNNTWGLGFSESFDIFVSTANNTHSGYYSIPHRHMKDVEGLHLRGVQKIDGHYLFHPITRNFRQVDVFGGFTAAAGHALYTARSFPKSYWNSTAFVSEPTGHLLHRANLVADGAGFKEQDGWNILASSDEWVSPVAAEVGPDGALWVLDWYNFIIQHNPTPPGFENGPGNAHINPLRDKQRGRIYRIVYKEAVESDLISLNMDNPDLLARTLEHENLLWRMHAQRLLIEGNHIHVKDQLLSFIADTTLDDMGLNASALHALWTLHGLGLIKRSEAEIIKAVEEALAHPGDGIRKAALQVLPNDEMTLDRLVEAGLFYDPNGRTRLAAINKLWELPSSQKLVREILKLTKDQDILEDLYLSRATYLAAVKHKDPFILTLAKDQPELFQSSQDSINQTAVDFRSVQISTENWPEVEAPKWLSHTGIEEFVGFSGIMWYRKDFELTRDQIRDIASIHIPGAGKEETYINGEMVGKGTGWDKQRNYKIPNGLLVAGKNSVAIRVFGGGVGGDPDLFYLKLGRERIPLAGIWKYNIEKIITSGKSEYADGSNIIDVFLKNYGPYALNKAKEYDQYDLIVDKKFVIKTIPDQMKYDTETIVAEPGDIIEIRFINNDAMQHNLLVLQPGALEIVGKEAQRFGMTKKGVEREYIPEMEEILYHTPLLNPREEFTLRIKLPDKVAEYPYVCTFPGHWRSMNGIIIVDHAL